MNDIRRIDDLGRIVIPKEIRKQLNIEEGERLAVTCKNGNVYFEKVKLTIGMDDLGRINVPKEIRETVGIEENDLFKVSVEENKICLIKQ